MNIVISSGHGKYIRGASGYLDEVDEARRVVERVADNLHSMGVGVKTFHDDTSHDQSTNLATIVNYHNSQSRDLDVSVHFNAYQTTSSPMGVEVLYVTQSALAGDLSREMADCMDLPNRGGKYRGDLYFLNNTHEPAILIETCFVDSSADADHYRSHFDDVCRVIAEVISGESMTEEPGEPEEPTEPEEPIEPPSMENRVDMVGVTEGDVAVYINGTRVNGDVRCRNSVRLRVKLTGDVVLVINGEEFHNREELPPPSEAPPLQPLSEKEQMDIAFIANGSAIARYNWDDRGVAPIGYMLGMAVSFAQTYRKLLANHPAAVEMAKARTSSDKDALNIYRSEFDGLGMSNEQAGTDTLRHLYALMLGHGMRESSGRHCEGRDMSASNVESDTAEAGLFQTSYNAHSASSPHFDHIMNEYTENEAICYLSHFDDDVSCSAQDWSCYGSGDGFAFQELCKSCPAFAVESCALTLRNLANHYGPIIRKETELKAGADEMFREVQAYMDGTRGVAV